jgi:RHS repeat-associated protein
MSLGATTTSKSRAYGNVVALDVQEIDNPLRFQGQYFDTETGLHYNRHRYYNPNTGRFLTPDPIKLAGGLNSYRYVNNPTGWVDPLGLNGCPGAVGGEPIAGEAVDPAAGVKIDSGEPDLPDARGTLIPDSYWMNKEAATEVTPGTKAVTDMKPSSRDKGAIYERTTHYDEYGRSKGQTHMTDHGEPNVHPNPHHHLRNPNNGQNIKGARPGVHPDYSTLNLTHLKHKD